MHPIGITVLVIILITAFFLISRLTNPEHADDHFGIHSADFMRGVISLLFAIGTVFIAFAIAFLSLINDPPVDRERFEQSKSILTILIGVFGTILGYYYGASEDAPDVGAYGPKDAAVIVAEFSDAEFAGFTRMVLEARGERERQVIQDTPAR